MQDSSMYQQIQTQFPDQEHLKCPRCDSTNTKFCYYNNYNLSQPRHFCKNCRRYWTKGGSLRNIPIGGGSRKNTKRSSNPKRPSPSPSSSSAAQPGLSSEPSVGFGLSGYDSDRRMLEMGGSFGSLLSTNGQFGNLMDGLGLGSHGSNSDSNSELDGIRNPEVELGRNDDLSCWGSSGNGWPDLAIYTPGSTFQ